MYHFLTRAGGSLTAPKLIHFAHLYHLKSLKSSSSPLKTRKNVTLPFAKVTKSSLGFVDFRCQRKYHSIHRRVHRHKLDIHPWEAWDWEEEDWVVLG